jgi:iron complex outermembrane receptor protein
VQRGPQGTLFGRNTFGGNIVVSTMEPQLGSVEGSGSLLLGSFKRARLELVGNAPVSDKFALRVAAVGEKADGYVKNDFNREADLFDTDLQFIRLSALFQPNDRFKMVGRLSGTRQGGNGAGGFSYFSAAPTSTAPAAAAQRHLPAAQRPRRHDRRRARLHAHPRHSRVGPGRWAPPPTSVARLQPGQRLARRQRFPDLHRRQGHQLLARRGVSLQRLHAEVDHRRLGLLVHARHRPGLLARVRRAQLRGHETKSASQEFQILSEGSGPFGYVAGVYFFREKIDALGIFQSLRRSVGNGTADSSVAETDSKAIYGQLSFKPMQAVTLTAGLRHTIDDKKYKFANRNGVVPISPNQNDPDRSSTTSTTWSRPRLSTAAPV